MQSGAFSGMHGAGGARRSVLRHALLPLGVAIWLGASVAAAPAQAETKPARVVATVGMVGDLAARLGGACVQVHGLVPAGADPHLYQPRPSDLRALQQADVVLWVGLGLEGRMADVLARLSQTKVARALGETLPPEVLLEAEAGAPDPHVWMVPALWAKTVPAITEALAEARPDCAESIAARQSVLAGELDALQRWTADSLASIPPTARVLVTAHDAFAYFAGAFGLEQQAIQGFTTEAEPSVADIRAVAGIVLEREVPAVFLESTIGPRSISALLEAVTARGGSTRIGGTLLADSMGSEGTPEGTYVGMIRANVLTLLEGLGGTAAPWPEALQGWAAEVNLAP